jgi:pSer/pThr/pTyr-binding forkhead associated (FHA) protein
MYQFTYAGKSRLLVKDAYTIGRAEDCDIRIDSGKISRHHARLIRTATGWDVLDLDSQNGTYVNDVPVTRHVLMVGDRLQFNGSEVALFEQAEQVSEATLLDATDPGNNLSQRITHIEEQLVETQAQSREFHDRISSRLEEVAASISGEELVPRIQSLEAKVSHLEEIDRRVLSRLDSMEDRARKALALGLSMAAALAAISFGSAVLYESERNEFRDAFVNALGGPTGIATALGALMMAGAAKAINPDKDEKSGPD